MAFFVPTGCVTGSQGIVVKCTVAIFSGTVNYVDKPVECKLQTSLDLSRITSLFDQGLEVNVGFRIFMLVSFFFYRYRPSGIASN